MKKFIPFMLILVVLSGTSQAATVQIGSGAATTDYLPLFTCYGYNYSQQIYLASEISGGGGEAGTISKIRFYYNWGGTDFIQWKSWKIFLGNTSKTAYSSDVDWISQSSMTQVFNGNISTPVVGTWLEITLSTPFSYSGGNLVVAVDENTAGFSCTASWRSFNAGTNRGILYYNDSYNPDPASPPSANYGPSSTLSQIQLEMTTTSPFLNITPGALAFGYIPAGSQSASQSYTLSGGNLVNSSVTVVAPTGYEVSVNNSTWSGSLNISFTPPSFASTTIYVRFVPFAENTDYSGNVTNICGTASKNLAVSGSTGLYNLYCTSYSTYPGYIGIGNVTLGTVNNTSTCSTMGGPGSVLMSYSNYTITIAPADLARSTNVPFSVDIIKCNYYDLTSCVAIFIDFNHNNVFTDAGEQVYLSSKYSTGAFTETGNFTIPPDATPGKTMMRVIDMYTTIPTDVLPCGAYYYGETEDYLVNITEAPACLPPGYLVASPHGHQSNLSWTELGSATSWDVEWGPAPFTPTGIPTLAGLTSSNTLLTDLTPLTSYTYYARSNCGSGSYSLWNGPKTFSTTVSCPAPANFVPSAITTNSATINWTSNGIETAWDIEYGPAGFTPGSGTGYTEVPGTSSKPYYLTGLTNSTQYDFYVRAACGPGDASAWSVKGNFSTLCDFVTSFPWTEGFEGMPIIGSKILPNCWSYENVVGTWGPSSSTTIDWAGGPHAGTHFIETFFQNTTWLFTPGMHLEAGVTYEFSFYMMNKYITDPINFEMDVACGTSNNSAGMTNILASGIICNNSSYSQFSYTIIPETTGNYYFGIKSISDPATPTWSCLSFDDFSLATTSCPSPLSVTATGVLNHSINAGWTGTCTNVQFDYGEAGHAAGSGTNTGSVTSNPFTINGLAANTSYDLYARQDCGGVYSIWQGPVAFTTPCNNLTAPFEEHFAEPTIPVCWSLSGPMNWDFQHVSPSPLNLWALTDHTTGGGGNYAWVGGFDNEGLTGITLLSPTISTSALASPQLRFYLYNNNGSTINLIDNQKLTVNLFDGADWHTAIFTWDYNQNAAEWQEIIVDLVPYSSSGTIRLSFVVDRGTGNPYLDDLVIDDIYVEEAPACPHPVALDAVAYGSTADLIWTSAAATFDVEFGAEGFTPTETPTYSGIVSGFTVYPLAPETAYSYYVRAICPPLTSTWAGPYTFTTPCLTVTAPFTEDFEGMTFLSPCWNIIYVSGSDSFDNWKPGYYASGYGSGQTCALADFFNQSLYSISDLLTPVFDASALTSPNLRFDYAYAAGQYRCDEMDVYYSIDAGHSWILLLPMSGAPGSVLNTAGTLYYPFTPLPDQWASITLPLPPGTNRIKFEAISNRGNNLYLDNIKILMPFAHDVAVNRFDFGGAANLGFIPKATVKNEGANTEDFDVTLTFGTWTSTKQVIGLAPDATLQVTFDICTLAAGDYPISVCTQLGTDQQISNDCETGAIKLLSLNKMVYAFCYDPGFGSTTPVGPVSFNLGDPGTLNSIADQHTLSRLVTGTWANGTWYAHAYYTDFMTLDPETGARTLITDYDYNVDGMSYNIANSTMYGVYKDNYDPNTRAHYSSLFSINTSTGDKTYIGRTPDNVMLINLAIDNAGNAYSLDERSNKLGSINLATGEWTEIGPVGFGCWYEQGMEFDHETGNLYMCTFNSSNQHGELRLVDTETGSALLIGTFNCGAHLTAFGIPYALYAHDASCYSLDFGEAANLGFIPEATIKNLGSNTEDFNVTLTIGTWTSTKPVTVLAAAAARQITFDACPLAAGDYPVSVCTQLISDMQTSNDCITGTVKLLNLNRKAFACGNNSPLPLTTFGPASFNLSTPGTLNTLGSQPFCDPLGGTWANGIWYACVSLIDRYNLCNTQFVTIDTLTGEQTVINPDMGKRILDISYNPVNNTMYGVGGKNDQIPGLYTIDMTTGEPTLVATLGPNVTLISLAIDYAGNAYAVDEDYYHNYFGSLDLATGDWDPIRYSELYDIDFDRRTGKLYALSGHTGLVELRLVDTYTGESLSTGSNNGFGGLTGLAIPYYPVAHDAAPVRFDFGSVATLGFTPLVTVMNEGTNTETFDVTLTIGTWTGTKTVNSLAPNALQQVAFDACPLAPGDYPVSVCTQLGSDMNTENDCKTRTIKLLNLNRQAYGYASYDLMSMGGPVSFYLGTPRTLNQIAPRTYDPLLGGAWANGTWYATMYWSGSNQLFCKIDPVTGENYIIGVTGKSFTGISYNPVNNKMYGITYNFLNSSSKLYTINMETGAPTLIGSSATGVNSLAIDNEGNAFAVNVETDQLGSINLATGAWTAIGEIGFDAYTSAYLAFDRTTGNLFMSTQELPANRTRLRWVNTSTGETVRIGSYPGLASIGGFAIPYGQFAHDAVLDHIEFCEAADLGFVPKATVMNEGDITETFNVTLSIGAWSSTKTVTSLVPFASQLVTFDPCPLPDGDYSVNVCTQLVTDMNTTNDCQTSTLKLLDLDKKVYAYRNSYGFIIPPGGPISFNLSTPGTFNAIADQGLMKVLSGGTFANGTWYASVSDTAAPYQFISIDTVAGIRTIIGLMGINIADISYNMDENTMYGIWTDGINSSLYSIDMATGAPTLIGPSVTGGILSNLAINGAGIAYSINSSTNQLGSINLATGAWTAIGDIGFNDSWHINGEVGMEFDRETGRLFLCTNSVLGKRELRLVNTATGGTLLIGEIITNRAGISGFAIPYNLPYREYAHDAALNSIDFNEVANLGFEPKATVINPGKNIESFSVTMTIGSWTSTRTVNSLIPSAKQQVVFDACTLPPGDYPVNVCTQLGTDMRPLNDCMSGFVKLLNLNKKVYAFCTGSVSGNPPGGPISFNLSTPGTLSLIANQDEMDMISGGTWASRTWYATNYNAVPPDIPPNLFFSIDTATGTRTVIGNMGVRMGEISFNPANNTIYGLSTYDGSSTSLYTIDMATGIATQVGTTAGIYLSTFAIDNYGNAFSIDYNSHQLGRIDLSSAAWTAIGDIGFGAFGWSSMEFDRETGYLYLCISNAQLHKEELRLVDTVTGGSLLIDKFYNWGTITGFAIPSSVRPVIAGPENICQGTSGNTYTTEPGFSNYVWLVSDGGIITDGGGISDNFVTVTWNNAGAQSVSVNYENYGVPAPSPTFYPVTVDPLPDPAGIISGPAEVCAHSIGLVYSVPVIPNATSYTWNLPAHMTITSGDGTNEITVDADSAAFTENITVQAFNDCGTGLVSSPFEVTSVFIPPQHGPISGNKSACKGATGEVYSIAPVPYADSYVWTLPPGASIVSGENTNNITVSFSTSDGNISVYATNVCGNGPGNPAINVKLWPVPDPPVITYDKKKKKLSSNKGNGNQWYLNGNSIPGADKKDYTAVQSGTYTDIITEHGCSSVPSNSIYVDITLKFEPVLPSNEEEKVTEFVVYPNPNQGNINYKITLPEEEILTIEIYNSMGTRVYKRDNIKVDRLLEGNIDLKPLNDGVYVVCLRGVRTFLTSRIIISN